MEDALEDFDIERLAKLVYQVDSWQVGGEPTQLTLWIRGQAKTIDMTDHWKSMPNQPPVSHPNSLVGLRNAVNAMDSNVIASIEKDGNSHYLVLTPAISNMGNLAVTDGRAGELITGRK